MCHLHHDINAMSGLHAHWTMPQYMRGSLIRAGETLLGTFRHRTAGTFPAPSFGHYFLKVPKEGLHGGSVWVLILGLLSVPVLWVRTHLDTRAPGWRMGLGSSPWFPGVSLPSCAKPNKSLNNLECWVLFLRGHECEDGGSPTWFMAGMEQALSYGSQLSTPRGGVGTQDTGAALQSWRSNCIEVYLSPPLQLPYFITQVFAGVLH